MHFSPVVSMKEEGYKNRVIRDPFSDKKSRVIRSFKYGNSIDFYNRYAGSLVHKASLRKEVKIWHIQLIPLLLMHPMRKFLI